MATSLRFLAHLRIQKSKISPLKKCYQHFSRSSKILLLSESYSCNETWLKHLNDPNLTQVTLSDFGYQVRDQLISSGTVSAVDINVLAHQLGQMDDDEADFIEDLLARYNMCQTSVKRRDSTFHAIVRGFLSKASGDGATRLARLLSEPAQFGLFPCQYSLNLVLDRLVESGQLAHAARVAYHTMLQEELGSNPSHTLLCLHAAVARLFEGPISELAQPVVAQAEGEEEEEEDWIKVKYIRFPVYDDHFDIKDERFLLGKTLHSLSKVDNINIPPQICASIALIGYGMHHKFQDGLTFLESVINNTGGDSNISQQAVDLYWASLEAVDARDDDEPEVEIALRTVDDVIRCQLPTKKEKDELCKKFSSLKEQLAGQSKIKKDFDLSSRVAEFVASELPSHEASDIATQLERFERWQEDRSSDLAAQVESIRREERLAEMKQQIKELQEQEELLSYFDFEENIRLTFLEGETDQGITISK